MNWSHAITAKMAVAVRVRNDTLISGAPFFSAARISAEKENTQHLLHQNTSVNILQRVEGASSSGSVWFLGKHWS